MSQGNTKRKNLSKLLYNRCDWVYYLLINNTEKENKMTVQDIGVFLNNWQTLEDMKNDFWPSYYKEHKLTGELNNVNVLLASYGAPSYEGYAFVLFERDGQLYEVNGSHCSCYGLEGQWDPEETMVEAIRHRIEHGNLGKGNYQENPFAEDLQKVLDNYMSTK